MKKTCTHTLCTALAILILRSCSTAPAYADNLMPIRWTADASKDLASQLIIAQGETRDLVCTLKNYGAAVVLPADTQARLLFQTNGMERTWWAGPATAETNGVITATWSPDLDRGAYSYTFCLEIVSGTQVLYQPYGTIRMRTSPGFIPSTMVSPLTVFDFATISVVNAPWTTPAAVSNIVTAAGGGTGSIDIEHDPVALPVASNALTLAQAAAPSSRTVNGKPLTSNITLSSSDVGALPLIGGLAAAEMFKATYGGLGGYSTLTPGNLTIGWSSASTVLPLKIDEDGISGKTFSISWPERFGGSQIATIADIDDALEGVTVDEADPLSIHTAGGVMTGPFKLAESGCTWQGVNIATNFTIRAEYDGTNISFNVYMEAK